MSLNAHENNYLCFNLAVFISMLPLCKSEVKFILVNNNNTDDHFT